MSHASMKRTAGDLDSDIPSFEDPADMVNAVIACLQTPEERTNVSINYSNEKNIATEVQAYAKISGSSWTYYVKSLAISIGRNTDNVNPGSNGIDIDLGPAKVVSRQHANITYDLDLRCWGLKILGRNGAKVDGVKVNQETPPTPLHSGAILDIGGTQMMFILPDSPPKIEGKMMESCLSRYKHLNKQRKLSYSNQGFDQGSQSQQQPGQGQGQTGQGQQKYTYFPQHTMVPQTGKTFQMFEKNPMTHSPSQLSASSLQSNLDQDLSKEESKDIKPPYSYATMITQAILSNEDGVMSLSEIYDWIANHYAYYKYSKTGWQNSIRHNLSLNKAFEKVPRRPNEPGKGMKWSISESYKDEFLNKMNSGSISKARRGSSVSRQLQLHLATHQALPEAARYYSKDEKDINGHSRSNSIGKNFMNLQYFPQQMAPLPEQQQQPQMQPQMQQPPPMQQQMQQQAPQPQSQPHSAQSQHAQLAQPPQPQEIPQNGNGYVQRMNFQPLMYNMPNDSPTRLDNTPKLPKTNNNLYNLPPPPPSSHSRSNSYNQPLTETYPSDLNTNATSDLALAFTSPKKIAPLEAFTPERGSKSLNKNLNIPNQSSPAFWNFVQFSTPNGQTPMKNDDVSPTINRKLNDKDSPIKKKEST